MSETEIIITEDGIRLRLTRVGHQDASATKPPKAVLLLHGASANRRTFEVHEGGLARHLAKTFDVWLLDWRGSSIVVDDDEENRTKAPELFNFSSAAQFDIQAALSVIRGKYQVKRPIGAVGHCMGSGVLAEAIARECVTHDQVDCIVLLTLGLFYEAPLDSRMKSEERILDRLKAEMAATREFTRIDPRVQNAAGLLKSKWPRELDDLYRDWPGQVFHARDSESLGDRTELCRTAGQMCNRLSFMYGMPYYHGNLVDEIHGTAEVNPVLPEQFGSIPLHMYLHAARNIRQRHATLYRPPESANGSSTANPKDSGESETFVSDAARDNFRKLKKITLITGDRNRLWHRNSIDLMYEWLTQGRPAGRQVEKHILPKYGHQDLLWGKDAPEEVYKKIEEGLRVPYEPTI
jgi:pimeloyl-ACP methyl ester carboxylesterase